MEIALDAFFQFFDIFRAVGFGEFVVKGGQQLFLRFDDFDFVNAFFSGELRGHKVSRKIYIDCLFLAGFRSDKLFGETWNEGFGGDINPKALLFGKALSRRSDFGDRLSVTGAGEIEHRNQAGLDRPLDSGKAGAGLAQRLHRALHVLVGDCPGLAFDRNAFVFGQLEFGRRLDRRF